MRAGRALVAVVGLADVGAAAALLLAPAWFFQAIGEFPPFNRHYASDAGAFLLPIGLGLIVAARDPVRFRPLLLVGILASWLHALNHAYDAITSPGVGNASLSDAATIGAMALLLTVGAILSSRGNATSGPT